MGGSVGLRHDEAQPNYFWSRTFFGPSPTQAISAWPKYIRQKATHSVNWARPSSFLSPNPSPIQMLNGPKSFLEVGPEPKT